MKQILSLRVQPRLNNNQRVEVVKWCTKQFGPKHGKDGETPVWLITSNYTRELDAEFDVIFNNVKNAEWFILKWGGVISNVVYSEETFAPDPEVLNRLFAE